MQLSELKKQILDKTFKLSDLIFKYTENSFLVNTYIDRIISDNGLTRIDVDSINDVLELENNVFDDTSKNVYVLTVDEFNDDITRYNINKIIVKTKKVTNENSLKKTIEFSKLENWQIEDYVKVMLPGLKEPAIKWLCDISNYDINRLDLECKKINIFDKKDQENIFRELNEDNMYEDLNSLTIFNFTNAIMRNNLSDAAAVLRDIKNIDVEPTGLVTILYKNFKHVIQIQMNNRATAESLKLSPKQFAAIKRNCNVYNNERLIKIFDLLTSVDYKLKSGLLENERIIDYLVTNIM